MASTERIRDTVYVVGAGFSAGLGYPLTKSLLIDVWSRLDKKSRDQLQRIIEFHHPAFTTKRKTTFPDIEQLLTEIAVNLELFDASRPGEGAFTKKRLEDSREDLLSNIAKWFHEIYEDARGIAWSSSLVERMRSENAAIVSFNWDLILDQMLFDEVSRASYGLSNKLAPGPVLLKPHGSLNWYEATQIQKVAEEKRIEIFPHKSDGERIEAFLHPREIKSKVGRRYTPLIVPPTYLKDFNRPVFRKLWNRCTEVLSTPRKLVFLGYSAGNHNPQFNPPYLVTRNLTSDQANPVTSPRPDNGFPVLSLGSDLRNLFLNVNGRPYDFPAAYSQQWNFTVQREFGGILIEAAYVATRRTN
jgi:hypothetical protein